MTDASRQPTHEVDLDGDPVGIANLRGRCRAMVLMVVLLISLAGFVAVAPAAAAHSTLVEACPDRGEVVSELNEINMVFGSPLVATPEQPPLISLSTGDGQEEVEVGPTTQVDDFTLTADVPDELAPGLYIARYQVLSRDGDLNDGGFQFTLDPDSDAATNCGIDIDDGSGGGGVVLLAVGAIGVLGLAFFLWPRRTDGVDVRGSSS